MSDGASGKPGLAARMAAHRLLGAIIDAATPMAGLTDNAHGHPHYLALDGRDRALVRAILQAALRFRADLAAIIDARLKTPLPDGATAVSHILHCGAAQILFLDVADRAAVDLAVEAANSDPRARRFSALVNAVLRRIGREREAIAHAIDTAPKAGPDWFAARIREAYGADKAQAIFAAHRRIAPVDLTLKRSEQPSAQSWAERLGGVVLPTGSIRLHPTDSRSDIAAMDGYEDGAWWVQDAASALPVRLFGDLDGMSVLDACAAPGGKTAQLADAGARVTALDLSKNRLKRLMENVERLGLATRVTAVAGDALKYEHPEGFDAVLLDAPCSSTGTVRRHPDVPWVKSADDISRLAGLQARLLDRVCHLVRPGGTLVFSNCSLDPLEGEAVAQGFAEAHRAFSPVAVTAEMVPGLGDAITRAGYLRTTPADLRHPDDEMLSGIDGFFAARFRRESTG